MAIHDPYATQQQLESRLSTQNVRAIYDDDNDGVADTNPLNELLKDASSKVDSYLGPGGILPLDPANTPREVVRLTLDVAVAMAAQRFPEVMRKDWKPLMDAAERELEFLRDGKTSLGPSPTPPSPIMGSKGEVPGTSMRAGVVSTRANTASNTCRRFDDMGDF